MVRIQAGHLRRALDETYLEEIVDEICRGTHECRSSDVALSS